MSGLSLSERRATCTSSGEQTSTTSQVCRQQLKHASNRECIAMSPVLGTVLGILDVGLESQRSFSKIFRHDLAAGNDRQSFGRFACHNALAMRSQYEMQEALSWAAPQQSGMHRLSQISCTLSLCQLRLTRWRSSTASSYPLSTRNPPCRPCSL